MRLDPSPRFPADVSSAWRKLTELFRDAAQQVNAAADGQMVASNNARTAIPTTGTYAKGDFVRKSAPSVSSSGIVVGWLRISDGSAHVLNTDWVECIVPTVNFLPLAGGTVTGNLTVNGNTTLGDAAADLVSTGGNLGVGMAGSGTAAEVLRINSTTETYLGWYRSAARKAYLQAHSTAGFLIVQEENLPAVIYTNNTIRTTIDASGNLIQNVNGTAPTLGTNGQMTFELTSNTELKIKVRGSDGTTRSVSLTLA